MAFNGNTQWDVRTTGSDANGGGFAYGLGVKDVTAATDLVVDGSLNTKVTSATHNFVSGDVNKYIQITAGAAWAQAYYQIISTASNAATLDRSPAKIGSTGGTYNLFSAIDYSQQNSPQISFTDMLIDGTTNTKFTSVGNPVTDAMVGNVINVTSGAGFTVQRVQIISQAAGTATCDKSLGTLNSPGGNGSLGGSVLTPNKAGNLMNGVAGNTMHIQSGTYTATTGTGVNVGNAIIPLVNTNSQLIGYGTNHYDGGTKPLITTATNNLWMVLVDGGSGEVFMFDNISFSTTAATKKPGIGPGNSSGSTLIIVRNCILDGFTIAIAGNNIDGQILGTIFVYGTEIKNSTSHGIQNAAGTVYLLDGTWIHGNAGSGLDFNTSGGIVYAFNAIITANAKGISTSAGSLTAFIDTSTIANNTGDGIFSTTGLGISSFVSNSIMYGNGGWGIDLTTASTTTGQYTGSRNNAFGSNTSGDRKNFPPGLNDINLTASPFVSSTNFALNATAGGGAACKSAGYPGVFAGSASTGYLDIGAVQTSGNPSASTFIASFTVG